MFPTRSGLACSTTWNRIFIFTIWIQIHFSLDPVLHLTPWFRIRTSYKVDSDTQHSWIRISHFLKGRLWHADLYVYLHGHGVGRVHLDEPDAPRHRNLELTQRLTFILSNFKQTRIWIIWWPRPYDYQLQIEAIITPNLFPVRRIGSQSVAYALKENICPCTGV